MPTSLLIVARSVQIAASLSLMGICTFETIVLRTATEEDYLVQGRLLHLAFWSLLVALLSGLLWFAFEVTSMSGLPLGMAFAGGSWWLVLEATTFGHVWQLRLGLMLGGLVLVGLSMVKKRLRYVLKFPLGLLAFLLLVSVSWVGHAAAAPEQPLGLWGDALHLCAAGAWLGGLPCLVIYLAATKEGAETGVLRRFSALSLCCVTLLVVSGVSNAWLLVGSLHALCTTRYGALLLVKLAFFAILVGFGARNHLLVKKRLSSAGAIASLRRNIATEICLGLAVIAVVGCLGVTPPPRSHPMQAEGK